MTATQPAVLDGRYRLGEVIGRGGMAEVYRATDELLSRPVAVKMLREAADDESDRQRFTAEARTLAGLHHPNLVLLLDAGITAERPYLVLELVDGPTMDQRDGGRPQSPERVAHVGAQVADALAYAHGRGVVHRDVKPGNVLLGQDGRPRLADFGIARLVGDTMRHTRTGQTIGTAAYLSPEQVQGDDVTPAADVYSLGLVLLEALTGERAYPGSPTEAALARLGRPPALPDWLAGPWRDLLTWMTTLDPAARPAAAEAAERLRGLAAGEPAAASRPDETLVMTTPGAIPAPGPDQVTELDPRGSTAAPPVRGRSGRARAVLRAIPQHLRVVLAVAGLLLLVIVVAALAGGDASEGRGDIPARTPAELRDPLQDLHDAVEGE